MAATPIPAGDFDRRLGEWAVDPALVQRLYSYYCELMRWNERISLVARGDVETVVERHFVESLAAVPMVPEGARSLLDVGSGGGFPGLVLAAVLPGLDVTLVEARDRKWAFLKRAAAVAGIRANCVRARIDVPGLRAERCIPGRVDLITIRAVRISMPVWQALTDRLSPTGRILAWAGRESPELPSPFLTVEEVPLAGSVRRLICFERRSQ